MAWPRSLVSLLLLTTAALAAGCGGDYPLVKQGPPPVGTVSVTTPSGAVVVPPPKPTVYATEPSPTCERLEYAEGGTFVAPPVPGLRARALTGRLVEATWSFRDTPDDCRPAYLLLSVDANESDLATPTTTKVRVSGKEGTTRISYPSFLPPPDVAVASAFTASGVRSRDTKVLISPTAQPLSPPRP
jgi:hypothetical protein